MSKDHPNKNPHAVPLWKALFIGAVVLFGVGLGALIVMKMEQPGQDQRGVPVFKGPGNE